ncbi:DUF58 domain-containing protein [Glaciimonas sp. PAMC28666]|uniref:DUF58 domain-containing protein n=1 Tax=Glaciimonas sp. PAMC28666 TaxID=2807626 RepID=UPI001F037D85|nr:DUF58 domain-containing protein [Glaciimonas sp. PAMC28666]
MTMPTTRSAKAARKLERRTKRRMPFRLTLSFRFPFKPREGQAETGEVYLDQRRVYILPTRAGCAFFGILVLLFIGSINYNLSLGFALTFVLGACAVIDMHLTFRNLAFLYLASDHNAAVFSGQEAHFALRLINRRKHARYAVWLGFIGKNLPELDQPVDVPALATCAVIVTTATPHRGRLAAPRVRLQTRFPLGLLRSWCYWQPDGTVIVYPQPEDAASTPPLPTTAHEGNGGSPQAGHEDFAGVRPYQPGDPLKHLAWRQIAKLSSDVDANLITKYFNDGAASDLTLDYAALPHALDVEAKLSRMTRWILEAEMSGLPYAFRIGDIDYAAAIGAGHQQACLQALALYEGTI